MNLKALEKKANKIKRKTLTFIIPQEIVTTLNGNGENPPIKIIIQPYFVKLVLNAEKISSKLPIRLEKYGYVKFQKYIPM